MALRPAASFGPYNRGVEVGQNSGTINTEIHLPPGRFTIERPKTPPPRPVASIYFSRDRDFISRSDINGDILEQIALRCSEPPRRVALVGLGGVGKSQLAIEHAYRVSEASADTWVFWVHAETRARVLEGFEMIADLVKLPGRNEEKNIMRLVYAWLADERNGKWVMILDSADDNDVFYGASVDGTDGRPLESYIPQSRNGSIVVTTRDGNLASKLTGSQRNVIPVGPMTKTDALTLFEKRLGSLSEKHRSVAADLVQALDFVPLAISQAAAYILKHTPLISIEKYLADFRKNDKEKAWLLEQDTGDFRRYGGASNSILTTWKTSFDHIQSKRPSAADLLSVMSFFDRQGIPKEVLQPSRQAILAKLASIRDLDNEEDGTHLEAPEPPNSLTRDASNSALKKLTISLRQFRPKERHIAKLWLAIRSNQKGNPNALEHSQGPVDAAPGNIFDESGGGETDTRDVITDGAADSTLDRNFAEDIAILRGYSLITTNEEGDLFEMHGLVQLSTKKWLERSGQQDTFKLQFIERLAAFFPPPEDDCSNWPTCQRLFPHFSLAEDYQPRDLGLKAFFHLSLNVGWYAAAQGRYVVTEQLARRSVTLSERMLGKGSLWPAEYQTLLAAALIRRGLYEEAEKLCTKVLETRKAKLGADHPDTLLSMNNLGNVFYGQDRFKEAEKMYTEVSEAQKARLGADHPATREIMNNLGNVFYKQDRFKEAEKIYTEVSEAQKARLGADHPVTLLSMNNLGNVFYKQDRLKEAEKIYTEVLEARKARLGADHPDTLTSMYNLAWVWRGQGRHTDALALMETCAQELQRVLGAEHLYTQYSRGWVELWRRE